MIALVANVTPVKPGACFECCRRGWSIFEVSGSEDDAIDGRYQVQRCDSCQGTHVVREHPVFVYDDDAWVDAKAAGLPIDRVGCLPDEWTWDDVERWEDAWRAANPGRDEPRDDE